MGVKRKETGIQMLFIRMIISAGISFVCVAVFFLVLFALMMNSGFVLSPSIVEANAGALLEDIRGRASVSGEDLPEGTRYALFDLNGELQETNLSASGLDHAREAALNGSSSYGIIMSQRYEAVRNETQICVLAYSMRAEFSSPVWKKIFPNAELLMYSFLLFLILGDVLLAAWFYARKVRRQADRMEQAALRIRQRDLDFQVEYTGLREFNRVLESLDSLKQELSGSLSVQWSMEQQRKEQMAALAHDIKTPLTVICGNAELLLEGSLDGEQREYVEFIEKNALQMRRYVSQLIDISRDGRVELSEERFSLADFLEEWRAGTQALTGGRRLRLETCFPESCEYIWADRGLLFRALLNLSDNAVQYSPEGGCIRLSCLAGENPICFQVEDQGKGFDTEALKYAKDQFYRRDSSRGDKSHYGMGLYIADQVAAAHGGSLTLSNRKDGPGAAAGFKLPRRDTL